MKNKKEEKIYVVSPAQTNYYRRKNYDYLKRQEKKEVSDILKVGLAIIICIFAIWCALDIINETEMGTRYEEEGSVVRKFANYLQEITDVNEIYSWKEAAERIEGIEILGHNISNPGVIQIFKILYIPLFTTQFLIKLVIRPIIITITYLF